MYSLALIATAVFLVVLFLICVGEREAPQPVNKPFVYQDIFENAKPDTTKFRKITGDYVSTIEVDGKKILKVAPEGLTYDFVFMAG